MGTETLEPVAPSNRIGPLRIDVVPPSLSAEDIARRAYQLYLQRGAGHGQDVDDWLKAERELMDAAAVG
jgi:hypothetical protein